MTNETKPKRRCGTRTGSLIGRLVRWAKENPDDDLTMADACIKFNTDERSLASRLSDAKAAGLPIEAVRVIRLKRGGS